MTIRIMRGAIAAAAAGILAAQPATAQVPGLDSALDIYWQDTNQATCAEAAGIAILAAGITHDIPLELTMADWYAEALAPDVEIRVFCAADNPDTTPINPAAERVLITVDIRTMGIEATPLRDYITMCLLDTDCTDIVAGAMETADATPARPAGKIDATPIDWDDNATGLRGQNGEQFTYLCPQMPPNQSAGSVYGTGNYTDDSAICRAAVHAGVITARGGPVTIEMAGDTGPYQAATQNGITSSSYGAWQSSYSFVR